MKWGKLTKIKSFVASAKRENQLTVVVVRVSEVQMHHTEHGKQTERIAVKDSVFIKHQNIVITEFWSIKIIVSNWQWVLVTLKLYLLFCEGFVTSIFWPWSFSTRDVCCTLQYHRDFFRVPVKTWAWVSHQGQVEKCRWRKWKLWSNENDLFVSLMTNSSCLRAKTLKALVDRKHYCNSEIVCTITILSLLQLCIIKIVH